MKKFSLLKKTDETPVFCDVVYDLSIDRAMANICPDLKRREYFLDTIAHPLTKRENILYRQEIFRNFVTQPALFSDLRVLFTRYDKIKTDWHEMKLSGSPAGASSVNPEAMLDHTYASLKVTAMFPNTIVSFFRSLYDTLKKYPLEAEGLIAIRDYCEERIGNNSLNEIVRIAQLFRYKSPEAFSFGVVTKINETMRVASAELFDIEEYQEKKQNMLSKLFSKKPKGPAEYPVEPDDNSYEDSVALLNEALTGIDSTLTQITNGVYEIFFGLSRELYFYEAAILYYEKMTADKIPLCVPEILEADEDIVVIDRLRDLLLASGDTPVDKIVPNDVEIDGTAGILVKGLTDTGKTVYLRSCAAAQLFGQAGLPVLADRARLSIRTAYFSHFSSAEEEFMVGDAAGRFDQEAKEIAKIMDRLTPHAMVFLNETFQTTSYREGTDAIFHVLSVLPNLHVKFLFVTHLTALFKKMDKTKVCLMETDDTGKYKLKRIL